MLDYSSCDRKLSQQVKSSIRLLCKCHRETNYILIIAVTDASMIYRERT